MSLVAEDNFEDKFDRGVFINALYNYLNSDIKPLDKNKNGNADSCRVVGLEGAWGTGKTFTIKTLQKRIQKYNSELSHDKKNESVLLIEFNPWFFKDTEHLSKIFLENLASEIIRDLDEKSWVHWAVSCIDKFSNFINHPYTRISLYLGVPLLVIVLTLIFFQSLQAHLFSKESFSFSLLLSSIIFMILQKEKYKEYVSFFNGVYAVSNEIRKYASEIDDVRGRKVKTDVFELKKQINYLLKEKEIPFKRIIIVIDDLDRLSPNEVQNVMQLIRMIADFDRVTYLVSYDPKQICMALGCQLIGADPHEKLEYSKGLLKKVITTPFTLPDPSRRAVWQMVVHDFSDRTSDIYEWKREGDQIGYDKYWEKTEYLFEGLFDSYRDAESVIDRAIIIAASLKSQRSHPLDVIFVSYLKQYAPEIVYWIQRNREKVLCGASKIIEELKEKISRNSILDNFYYKSILENELFIYFLQTVFPNLRSTENGFVRIPEQEKRICHPDYFEGYFNYILTPSTEYSDFVRYIKTQDFQIELQKLTDKLSEFETPIYDCQHLWSYWTETFFDELSRDNDFTSDNIPGFIINVTKWHAQYATAGNSHLMNFIKVWREKNPTTYSSNISNIIKNLAESNGWDFVKNFIYELKLESLLDDSTKNLVTNYLFEEVKNAKSIDFSIMCIIHSLDEKRCHQLGRLKWMLNARGVLSHIIDTQGNSERILYVCRSLIGLTNDEIRTGLTYPYTMEVNSSIVSEIIKRLEAA